jgi:hypothetical protein
MIVRIEDRGSRIEDRGRGEKKGRRDIGTEGEASRRPSGEM